MCIAQKHFNKFNKRGEKPAPLEGKALRIICFCRFRNPAMSTVAGA